MMPQSAPASQAPRTHAQAAVVLNSTTRSCKRVGLSTGWYTSMLGSGLTRAVLGCGQAITRPFHYAIIDEADSVLIDDCRNPLIISSTPNDASKERFVTAHKVRTVLLSTLN